RLGGFTEDVGVDQVRHRVLVDSDSTGTKNPFSGHASSQSTTPSLGRALRRRSRYSPRSRRSTSNSWPASMSSCCRISAGRTIWPFEDTLVFMEGKISSYLCEAKQVRPYPSRISALAAAHDGIERAVGQLERHAGGGVPAAVVTPRPAMLRARGLPSRRRRPP